MFIFQYITQFNISILTKTKETKTFYNVVISLGNGGCNILGFGYIDNLLNTTTSAKLGYFFVALLSIGKKEALKGKKQKKDNTFVFKKRI